MNYPEDPEENIGELIMYTTYFIVLSIILLILVAIF